MRIPLVLFPMLAASIMHAATVAPAVGELEIPLAAAGSPVLAAIDAFNKGEDEKAMKLARRLAQKGNPEAFLLLGLGYELGRGLEPSREQAVDSYRKAVKSGNTMAVERVTRLLVAAGDEKARKEARSLLGGLLYGDDTGLASRLLGEGLLLGWFGGEPDYKQALHYLGNATEKGDTKSMILLGRLLDGDFGYRDQRDPSAAIEQFLKACALGDTDAMIAAASRLLMGDESVRDEKLGRVWLTKASELGNPAAYLVLGNYEETWKKNEQAALEQFRRGAEKGQAGCMVKLADYLLKARGDAQQDTKTALDWFKKGGKAGDAYGYVGAGRMLLAEDDRSKKLEGFNFLIAAANAGLVKIQNEVGEIYLSDRAGVRDPVAAAAWIGRASAGGFIVASYNLANLNERGIGVPRDYNQAGRLYTHAANTGHPQAALALARLHQLGLGTPKNLPMAWALLKATEELGHEDAKGMLKDLESRMTAEQIEEGRKAQAGFKKLVEGDDPAGEH